ncbi:unnamed protein product, partial [marine sediment metagenome]
QYQNEMKLNQERTQKEYKQTEQELVRKEENLTKEIEEIESKIRDSNSQWEREKKRYEKQIEKLSLELAVRKTDNESQKNKLEYELKKIQNRFETRISDLKNKFDENREYWETKIQYKDDEINSLKLRIAARDMRLQAERDKRKQELEYTASILGNEMTELVKEHKKIGPSKNRKIKRLQEKLLKLQNETSNEVKTWDEQQKLIMDKKEQKINELGVEIDEIEKQTIENINML